MSVYSLKICWSLLRRRLLLAPLLMMPERNIFEHRWPIRLLGLLRFSLTVIDELFILRPRLGQYYGLPIWNNALERLLNMIGTGNI